MSSSKSTYARPVETNHTAFIGRVLHVGKYLPPHPGGMETYLQALMDEQRSLGVDAITLVHGTGLETDPPWVRRVTTWFSILYTPIAPGFAWALSRCCAVHEPDVIHFHLPNPSAFWGLMLSGVRRVPWVIHWQSDVLTGHKSSRMLRLAYRLYKPFESAMLERADRVIVSSPNYLDASEPLQIWRNKVSIIPLGIARPIQEATSARDDGMGWRCSGDHLRLLTLGRLAYYKGLDTLIMAVQRTPGTELVVAGDGECKEALASLIAGDPASQNRIRLVGGVSESAKAQLMSGCDLFCMPSNDRAESFGLVLLEAMWHAKACAVTNLEGSGMPWIVARSECGFHHLQANDVDGWAKWLVDLVKTPREELKRQLRNMGGKGKQHLESCLLIEHSAREISALYGFIRPQRLMSGASAQALVVIPARNEASTIGLLVDELRANGWLDVLVVDDHSTDNTGAIARSRGANVVRPALPTGAWGAMQLGLSYGVYKGYQSVVTMDADGQHEVSELPKLLAKSSSSDVVVGSFPMRASRLRRLAWGWFRLLAGFELEDLTSGFRCYNRKAAQLLISPQAALLDYQDLGALLLLRRSGLTIEEVPVSMQLRSTGKSRIFSSWTKVVRYMAITSLVCLSYRQLFSERRSREGLHNTR